ncbi:urease accessory protein UreH domain-containing protein [Carboxylicivirga linearis]|uniref:Sulfite exporter TauE/SafE family protein n=1 Tax=Carboxylicivirga linearis TaxID=1628157 RepID=A0ABS5JYX3_9BACT|nr:sulfite exporter TauE/SafE family protein [Carboxylicivirga linearis]MBS2099995.1 sulfite exporter TauE/SafE family protein [Carboxylicivirga linearis]
MTQELQLLLITAASVGFFHTLMGPDHYLPFIMIGKAREWSLRKVIGLTLLCGVGHILSSVVLGFFGIALQVQVAKLEFIESFRGNLAAWAFIAFGLLYTLWGIRHWIKKKHHGHSHGKLNDSRNITPWVLFIIFALGPCEPLIPVLMYPAVAQSTSALILVTSVFGVTTLLTMVAMVVTSTYGLSFINIKKYEHLSHSIAGMVIFLSGLAMQFLGL